MILDIDKKQVVMKTNCQILKYYTIDFCHQIKIILYGKQVTYIKS